MKAVLLNRVACYRGILYTLCRELAVEIEREKQLIEGVL